MKNVLRYGREKKKNPRRRPSPPSPPSSRCCDCRRGPCRGQRIPIHKQHRPASVPVVSPLAGLRSVCAICHANFYLLVRVVWIGPGWIRDLRFWSNLSVASCSIVSTIGINKQRKTKTSALDFSTICLFPLTGDNFVTAKKDSNSADGRSLPKSSRSWTTAPLLPC